MKAANGLWRSHDGRLVAPLKLCPYLIKGAHGPTHAGKLKTLHNVLILWWHPNMKGMVDLFCDECTTCGRFNVHRPYTMPMGGYPVPSAPCQDITIDYTDMGVRVEGKRYLLVRQVF